MSQTQQNDEVGTGPSAIVTGASRGIGRALAISLAADGAQVTAVARTATALDELARERQGIVPAVADVSRESDVEAVVAAHVERHGGLDILINNAGVGAFGPVESIAYADFLDNLAINAGGTFLFSRAALPILARQKSGDIINIASVVAQKGYPNQSAYSASKHAVLGLTKALAEEAWPHGVRVRSICPGGVDTEMIGDARPDLDRSGLMRVEDVVETVRFLLRMSDTAVVDNVNLRRRGTRPWF